MPAQPLLFSRGGMAVSRGRRPATAATTTSRHRHRDRGGAAGGGSAAAALISEAGLVFVTFTSMRLLYEAHVYALDIRFVVLTVVDLFHVLIFY
jgi:hypothetical protein